MNTELRLAGVIKESIVDGPGFRFVVFAQGCPHHCDGCHNPETHDFNGGYVTTLETLADELKKNKLLKGITLSGGEPFCQAAAFSLLANTAHELGLTVITYTGYTLEKLLEENDSDRLSLLHATDILVDGRFVKEQKSLLLKFRGSKNQRVIDVKASLLTGKVTETEF